LSIIVFAFYIGGPDSGMIKGLMFFLSTVWAILPGFLGKRKRLAGRISGGSYHRIIAVFQWALIRKYVL
jgi:hypothetical protein